ncbi:MAG: hypothetical protein JEZ02_08055 [Desulfatibacillum sp.]|nr:hypothetical protein [Desulfatibacillum sp.]
MRPIKLYAGLFLLFALGVFAGGLGMGLYAKHQRASFFEGREGKHLEFILEHMSEQLALTEEQQGRIRTILEDFQEKMITLRQKNFPELDALFKDHRARIREVLTREQQESFEKFEKRMMQRRPPGVGGPEKPFGKGGPKPPPGPWSNGDGEPHAPPFPEKMQ